MKICGITNLEDAIGAAAAGADAVGFIFTDQSPRRVTPDQAERICRELPPFLLRVGVFYNQPVEEVEKIAQRCALDRIQLHGDETPEVCARFGHRTIKTIRVKDQSFLERLGPYRDRVEAFLLDTHREGQAGGTGGTFNWEIAARAKGMGKIILAGGLTPENVAEAVAVVQPYGVDVSSGVEAAVGKKDLRRVRRFVERAKGVLVVPR